MQSDGLQLGVQEKQLKKEVAYIMSCFEDTIGSYANNRRELQLVLNQLLKAHRSYRIHKNQNKILTSLNNKQDVYFEFYLVNNISCCYQTKKEYHRALEYLKLADKQLNFLQQLVQKSELDYETRKLQLINIHMRIVKVKLNLCGLYALSEKHMEALYECSSAFGVLQSVIDSVCDYSMGQKNYQDFLELQKCAKDPASQIKEFQIKNNYWNQVMNGQSDDEVRDIFLSIFKNSDSKEQVQVRSSLGKIITKNIQKIETISQESRIYLKNFNIAQIMKVAPLNIEDFSKIKQKSDYVSLRFLHELMIYLSVSNYIVSTQIRVTNMYGVQSMTSDTLTEDDNSNYRRQKKIMEAERHHFFSIEMMYRMASSYVKDCPFFCKLIKIYQQVYLLKDNIQIIPEKVDEQNQISTLPQQKSEDSQDQYFTRKFKQSTLQTPKNLKKALSSHKQLIKSQKKQKQRQKLQLEMKKKKTKKSSQITKNDYVCMSPRASNTNNRLGSEQKRLKDKNKSTQKIASSTSNLKKSRAELIPKSPRKMFGY